MGSMRTPRSHARSSDPPSLSKLRSNGVYCARAWPFRLRLLSRGLSLTLENTGDMFHDIPPPMLARMRELEQLDRCDRTDGTPRLKRLRQIPPEVGKFIAIMAT